MPFSIGVPAETADGERRVAMVPEVISRLTGSDFKVVVESGAGSQATFSDSDYREAGAEIGTWQEVLSTDLLTFVSLPDKERLNQLGEGTALIGFLKPFDEPEGVQLLAERGLTAFSVELIPRITRAQKMDALSAMGAVGGYRAVLEAGRLLPKFFPLLTTAAGTMRPAKVLILGAGVAGLQAIATARRLGAVVSAYDVRPAVKEEVKSLGAKFIELELETTEAADQSGYAKALDEEKQRRQVELLVPHLAESDVVITTALIPGKPAPLLISEEAVEKMQSGSVIVDLAAANGGNCALTQPGQTINDRGVTITGPLNLPSDLALDSSRMYSKTLSAFINEFVVDGNLNVDFEDEIIKGACVSHEGKVVHERVSSLLSIPSN